MSSSLDTEKLFRVEPGFGIGLPSLATVTADGAAIYTAGAAATWVIGVAVVCDRPYLSGKLLRAGFTAGRVECELGDL